MRETLELPPLEGNIHTPCPIPVFSVVYKICKLKFHSKHCFYYSYLDESFSFNINSTYVCLYGVFRPTREFFTHSEKSPLPLGLQILTYARHSWPLSSEGSLACHTYCDMGR